VLFKYRIAQRHPKSFSQCPKELAVGLLSPSGPPNAEITDGRFVKIMNWRNEAF
jgi:hypothetical protein